MSARPPRTGEVIELDAIGADEWQHAKHTTKLHVAELTRLAHQARPRAAPEVAVAPPTAPIPTAPAAPSPDRSQDAPGKAPADPGRWRGLAARAVVAMAAAVALCTLQELDPSPVPSTAAGERPGWSGAPPSPAPSRRAATASQTRVAAASPPHAMTPDLPEHAQAPVHVEPLRRPRDRPHSSHRSTDDARALYAVATRRLLAGDAAGAVTGYRRALALEPAYAVGYRGLGLAYDQLGRRAEAARALRTYLRLAPHAKDAAMIEARLAQLR